MEKKFTITIATKNRLPDLIITLASLQNLLKNSIVHCLICDDGSTDGTYDFITSNYPNIEIFRNDSSQGIHYARNKMFDKVQTPYVVSIDDDVHFITDNPLPIIENHFLENEDCAIVAFRIFWSKKSPLSTQTNSKSTVVKSFGAGACAWKMSAKLSIPSFPEWFLFYGEEDFASYQLFKKNWQVHYLPEVLVNHRVDLKARKNNFDYTTRLRRSLRSGWYLFFMFYPISKIPRKMAYSIWMQFKLKVFKGDFRAFKAIMLALFDLVWNSPKILKNQNRLTVKEYEDYQKLAETKLYWNPENEQK
jgi:glycosyltransferase involved in cell wall biosynthesis